MRWTHWLILGIGSLVILTGCATTRDPLTLREKTLFERVGGKPYLTAMVDDFVVRLAANRRLQRFFTESNRPALQARFLNQLCEASGGPCKYTGTGVPSAPQGMGLTSADFEVVVEEFSVTLDKFKVAENEQRELLTCLAPLRQELVQR